MVEGLKVQRSVVIKADQARVWKALTTPSEISTWFQNFEFDRLQAGAKFKTSWEPNESVRVNESAGEIAIVEPMSRFGYRWQIWPPDPQMTLVVFDLEAVPEGTRVTVTETGFEVLSDPSLREKRFHDNEGGWEYMINRLAHYAEGQAAPAPLSVERSVWINASRERVWKAITEPDQVGRWFSPGSEWRSTGLEVGGRLSLIDPSTGNDAFTQVITVFDAPNELITQDAAEHPHTTHWTLKDENGGTRLLLIFSGYDFEPEDVREQNLEENGVGFSAMLRNVKAHIEGEALPYPQGF